MRRNIAKSVRRGSLRARAISLTLGAGLVGAAAAAVPPPPPLPPKPPARKIQPPKQASVRKPSAAKAPKVGARIEFASKVYDFGRVAAGKEVRAEFVFTNTGTETLHIASVHPSCGCTTTGEWPRELAPGKSGKIPVVFNTKGYGGKVAKYISVVSSAVNEPLVSLKLTGEVWRPVTVLPAYAYFRWVAGVSSNATATVRIQNNTDVSMKILGVESPDGLFKAELREVKPGKVFEAVIRPARPFTKGSHYGALRLKTNLKEAPEVELRAYASVVDRVAVVPTRLLLSRGPLPRTIRRYVSVRANDKRPIRVVKAEVSGAPNVRTTIQEVVKGRMYRVALDFPKGFELKTGDQVAVKIRTDRKEAAELTVPVIQPSAAPPRLLKPPVASKPARKPSKP
ncbi:MAG: DUF1573 domain-containing protein [Verrucomicrobia bacterium]|nr:DUF1573 domain-containing protein [Verrucomicrobiota bacterium]